MFRSLLFIGLAVMLGGCLSAPKRVHKEMPEVQREWLAN
jgi:starvation-inducible outer membrane lipoprotein